MLKASPICFIFSLTSEETAFISSLPKVPLIEVKSVFISLLSVPTLSNALSVISNHPLTSSTLELYLSISDISLFKFIIFTALSGSSDTLFT